MIITLFAILSLMIQLVEVSKSFGTQKLFNGLTFPLNKGEKCALVGKNGTGKSTLLRIIAGLEEPDSGTVQVPSGYRVGMLEQHINFTMPTVVEEACLGLPPENSHEHYRAEKILFGLGFTDEDMEKDPKSFSGGYQIRIELCKLLLSEPDLMLLDEPSNYLDVLSMRWLCRFLQNVKAELILISHDREFLDEISTHTIGIHRGRLKKVEGGTEEYYTQILQEEEVHEKTRMKSEKQRAHMQSFIDRFGAKATKAAQARSREKAIKRLPVLEKLANIHHLDFDFHYSQFNSQKVLTATDLSFGYNDPLIVDFNFLLERGQKIALIGKNGKGKSTLLRLLSRQLEAQSGTLQVSEQAKIGYFGQTNINLLDPKKTIYEEISEANPLLNMSQVKAICGTMMFPGDDASKTISVLSGGERSRVLLGKILAEPCNLLLLDEPTNHLDMESVEALITAVEAFQGAVILVTHTEWILHRIAQKLIICHEGSQEVFEGTYEDFLRKVGWQEETPQPQKKKAKAEPQKPKLSNNKIASLEKAIAEVSTAIDKKNEEITQASMAQDSKKIAACAKELALLNEQLENLFSQFTID